MLDIHVHVFPLVDNRENKSIIDKNIMSLCFTDMLYLFLGFEVERETKK